MSSSSSTYALVPYTGPPTRPPGKSRSSRRRFNKQKKQASSGILVPSAQVAATRPPRRPSNRGRRGRKGQGFGGYRGLMPMPYNSGKRDATSRPAFAISGPTVKTYYKQSGAPKHKEWGEGVRFVGCSLLGAINQPSGTNIMMTPTIANSQAVTSPIPGTMYNNLYWAVNSGFVFTVYALHPGLIPRLQKETYNWGRYVFRKIIVHSSPISSTSDNYGFAVGLTHDTSWPLNQDQAGSYGYDDVAQLGSSAVGAMYESFEITLDDFKGDRTWPTTLPSIIVGTTSADPPSTLVGPFSEDYYQYVFATNAPIAEAITSGFRGSVYVSYVVDFYSVKADTGNLMEPLIWNTTSFEGGEAVPGPMHMKTVRLPAALGQKTCPVHRDALIDKVRKDRAKLGDTKTKEVLPLEEDEIPPPPRLLRLTGGYDVKESSRGAYGVPGAGRPSGRDPKGTRSRSADRHYDCPCCGETPCIKGLVSSSQL